MRSIYLDHNSTTPLAAEAAAAMAPWQDQRFGNPASQHQFGRRARQTLEEARDQIGRMLGARTTGRQADRVIFTSGGTEANNLALLGLARVHDRAAPGQAIISAIEHPSVAEPAAALDRLGWKVHRVGVTPDGVVDLDQLASRLSADTQFASVMLANNETGVIQPVAEIARRVAALGVCVHTDAAQAVGKLPVDFQALGVGLLSVAAHKFHGPLGIGALIVRHDVALQPIHFGGFQQQGLRPGTESVALAVGMQAALAAWEREGSARTARLAALRDRLEAGLIRGCAGAVVINGAAAERLPHTSNLAFPGIDRQAFVMALDLAGIACSTGSACASGSSEPSTVLAAMGVSPEVLSSSLRFSLGATTTEAEIDEAIERMVATYRRLATSTANRRTPV